MSLQSVPLNPLTSSHFPPLLCLHSGGLQLRSPCPAMWVLLGRLCPKVWVCLYWAPTEAGTEQPRGGVGACGGGGRSLEGSEPWLQGPVLYYPHEDEQTELPQQQNHAGPPLCLCLSAQWRHSQYHSQCEYTDISFSIAMLFSTYEHTSYNILREPE